jgi:hypothetical protein
MDMIGHHNPRPQIVSFAVIKSDGPIHETADAHVTQVAFPAAFIQVSFNLLAPLSVIFQLQQCFSFRAEVSEEAVRQMERNKLNQPRLITVRKITALMPAAKTLRDILFFGRR